MGKGKYNTYLEPRLMRKVIMRMVIFPRAELRILRAMRKTKEYKRFAY